MGNKEIQFHYLQYWYFIEPKNTNIEHNKVPQLLS